MVDNMKCFRCNHTPDEHWPNHNEPRTCCSTCMKEQYYTKDPVSKSTGLCCVPATSEYYFLSDEDVFNELKKYGVTDHD